MELEKVQRRAAPCVLNDYGRFSSAIVMLDQLSLPYNPSNSSQAIYLDYNQQLSLTINPYILATYQQHDH